MMQAEGAQLRPQTPTGKSTDPEGSTPAPQMIIQKGLLVLY